MPELRWWPVATKMKAARKHSAVRVMASPVTDRKCKFGQIVAGKLELGSVCMCTADIFEAGKE